MPRMTRSVGSSRGARIELATSVTSARVGSGLPLGAVVGAGGPGAALPWVAVLLLALWAMERRNTSHRAALRVGWVVAIGAALSLFRVDRFLSPDDRGKCGR